MFVLCIGSTLHYKYFNCQSQLGLLLQSLGLVDAIGSHTALSVFLCVDHPAVQSNCRTFELPNKAVLNRSKMHLKIYSCPLFELKKFGHQVPVHL